MDILESFSVTDLIVILGFLFTFVSTKTLITERQRKHDETLRDVIKCLDTKAEKKDIQELKATETRIFDILDSKESKEDAQEWREQLRRDSNEIKIAVRDMALKIDKYIVNRNGKKPL